MSSQTQRLYHILFIITSGCLGLTALLQADEIEQDRKERDVNIQRASIHMKKCEMHLADDTTQQIDLIGSPLLTFGDLTRLNTNGTLWAFGKPGRPHAFLELYQGIDPDSQWCHAVTLTGTKQVHLKTPNDSVWTPKKTQIEPKPIPDAPLPDEKESPRLRQLKQLSRRFSAHEFWDPDNSRFELRLLVQPIHRYQDPQSGVQDAAVFALANGTNPEILLLIEALGDSLPNARWHYSLAALGSAELVVDLDGKLTWKRDRTPGVIGTPNDPYWLFFTPSAAKTTNPE